MSLKTIALVAHDHKKADIVVWAQKNKEALALFKLVATGTTGSLLIEKVGLDITRLQSGPLGGDQQIGALIAEQKLDALFFFWDPMNPV
ncbi:MAG: methylglyoxal synthase, partial [Pseudoalteromonas sp.]